MPCERKHIEAIQKRWRILDSTLVAHQAFIITGAGLKEASDLDTVIDNAMEACDESPWRSMESAPKDETTVDLWTSAGERLADCHYCVSTGTWKYWLDGRWVHIVSTPTHWMHLPAAPEGKP